MVVVLVDVGGGQQKKKKRKKNTKQPDIGIGAGKISVHSVQLGCQAILDGGIGGVRLFNNLGRHGACFGK